MKKFIYIFLFIALIAFGFYAYFILGNQSRSWRAAAQGKDYVTKMYNDYSVAGNSCQGEDSDKDGYVTCNFRLKSLDSIEKTITLQCPTFVKSFMATNCKEQGIVLNQN